MTEQNSQDSFVRNHPLLAGLAFTLMLMPGVYFATGAHEKGSPTILQMLMILLIVGPVSGYLLKFLADRRAG